MNAQTPATRVFIPRIMEHASGRISQNLISGIYSESAAAAEAAPFKSIDT
jgi:hypothetical protein